MSNHARLVYLVRVSVAASANLQAAVQNAAGVPFPDIMNALGVRVTSDVTSFVSPNVQRVIDTDFGPSTTADIVATLLAGSPLDSVVTGFVIQTEGIDYIVPPDILLTGGGPKVIEQAKGRAFLNVQGDQIISGGTLYSAGSTIAFVGGLPPALFVNPQAGQTPSEKQVVPVPNGPPYVVQGLTIVKKGRGYSTSTKVQFIGGILGPGGVEAQAIITSFGPNGEILGLQIIDPGTNYTSPPQKIGFFDPMNPGKQVQAGTEAVATLSMGAGRVARATLTFGVGGVISAVVLTDNGDGYVGVPTTFVFDPLGTGSGANIRARMGVSRVDVLYPGQGYSAVPTVTPVPHFKSLFPDTSDQKAPFWNLMSAAIQQATMSPVIAQPPSLT